jgi:hypothetical protein
LVVLAEEFVWMAAAAFLVELAVKFFSEAIVALTVALAEALVWVAAVALAVEFTVAFF